eukprot:scaffold248394_cov46-Cyclotella_meneghiniana.AAC.3
MANSLQHCHGNHIDNECSQCQRLQETISELQRECEILRQANSTILQRQLDGEAEISRLKEENKSLQILFEEADKRGKYHDFVKKNRHWEYPVDETTLRVEGFDSDDLVDMADITTKMRRGEVVNHIDPISHPEHPGYYIEFFEHYKEFADALTEYRHTINFMDDQEFRFSIGEVEIPEEVLNILQDALQQTHFHELRFYHNHLSGVEYIDFIASCVEADTRLKKLTLNEVDFGDLEDMDIMCTAINNNNSLQELYMSKCNCTQGYYITQFDRDEGGFCDVFTKLKSKSLKKIVLKNIGISNLQPTDMTEFLSSNPTLENLDMRGNRLFTQDIRYISDALRQNTTLRHLELEYDGTGDILESVIFDQSSLNAAYDSNHSCHIDDTPEICWFNMCTNPVLNRRKKLYNILSRRNRNRENAAYFESDDIGIKHIPQILSLLKPFSEHHINDEDAVEEEDDVHPLSIAFEIMRDWKMPELYNNLSVMNED